MITVKNHKTYLAAPATVRLPEGDYAEDDLSAVHIAGGQAPATVPVTAVSHDVPKDRV